MYEFWGSLAMPQKITVRSVSGERFERIVDWELGVLPQGVPTGAFDFDQGEIPF